ncbi:uncharacterized protein LOC129002621 [Macrosteles quadrilineatus]|uniref:uncharacterized protein LOC129002621 n=1 Tax=Macrosteles quadrilineatus TaxID=74068 RepID=UPI0023E19B02|nr:uncharacterized protein LOC129002621 [Macrosteles quadrilineatus]
MLISPHLTVSFIVAISCLASAFSTLFVTEGVGEVKKTVEMETKTPKTEESNVGDHVVVETIPFFTNVISKVEDAMNLTPLKVATIISAQHLIDSVNNIPVSGNLPQDNLNMLTNIVEEFNKTTQIIKLTAEYVNISSHYVLNSLNQLVKENCDKDYITTTMKSINANFLNIISNNVKVAVREITEKTAHREMTGTDVLVSSAYHIVQAFHEMTSQVMSLNIDNSKCDLPKTPQNSDEIIIIDLDKKSGSAKHDGKHQSIKKDKALHDNKPTFTFTNHVSLDDTLTMKNNDENTDLTIEINPHEPLTFNNKDKESANQQVEIPQSLRVAFLPETKTTEVGDNQDEFLKLGSKKYDDKLTKKNLQNHGLNDFLSINAENPKEGPSVGIFSSKDTENAENKKVQSESNKNDQQKLESLNVYYYPFKTVTLNSQNENHLPNYLQVPPIVNKHYIPQNLRTESKHDTHLQTLKEIIAPFKTFSLFGNSNFWNNKNMKPQQKQEDKKSEGSQTNFKNFDDTLTIENLNRQDLTEEVFSPEAFEQQGKYLSSGQKKSYVSNVNTIKSYPSTKWMLGGFKNGNLKHQRHHNHLNNKNKINYLDRELASSADGKITKTKLNVHDGSTVLMPWDKRFSGNQHASLKSQQEKPRLCSERVEPICGVDRKRTNFIIFINDCERMNHNILYKTNFLSENMDTCVGFLLKYSSGKPTKYVNIIPQK